VNPENIVMTKINTRLLVACYLSSVLILFVSCRKHKETIYHLQGRLLLSNTNPIPVPSYSLEFRQQGSAAVPLPAYTSSSSATTTTDAQGNFKCEFKPGESKFFGFRGDNLHAVYLEGKGNASFPHFSLGEIFLGNMGDIYLCKKIDTVILTVDAQWGIIPSDTLRINFLTMNGRQEKLKTGLSAATGTLNVVIDTLYNAIFTMGNYKTKTYGIDIYVRQTPPTQSFNIAYSTHWNDPLLGQGDEKKHILNLR
jgi:hypothetical protein